MADETVNISIQADIQQLKAALGAIPGVGKKESQRLVNELTKSYKQAEQAAKRAAGNSAKEWDKSLASFKQAGEKSAALLGGSFGKVGEVVFGLGEKLGGVGGAAGIAVAGLAAAGVATVSAAVALDAFVDSADVTIKRLGEIGGARPIPAQTIAALDEYRQRSLGVEESVGLLKVQLAGLVSVGLEPAAATAIGAANAFAEMLPNVERVREEIQFLQDAGRVVTGILSLGGSEVLRYGLGLEDLAEAGRDTSAALTDLAVAQAKVNAHQSAGEAFLKIQRDTILAMTGASKAQRQVAHETDAVDEATKAYIDTLDEANPQYQALADAAFDTAEIRKQQIVAEAKLEAATKSSAKAAREAALGQKTAAQSTTETEEEVIARIERIGKLKARIAEQDAEYEASKLKANELELQHQAILLQAVDAVAKAEADKQAYAIQYAQDRLAFTSEIAGGLSDLIGTASDAAIAAAKDGTKAQKEAALEGFRAAQAAQIAAATVDAIRAGVSLVPSYSFLGPGAFPAAAATAGLGLAVAVGRIEATEPPSFERGGIVQGGTRGTTPDHVMTQAQPGEGYLTRRGVAASGGAAGVERLNQGRASGGQPVRIPLYLNGRQIAEATYDPMGSLRSGSPLGRR